MQVDDLLLFAMLWLVHKADMSWLHLQPLLSKSKKQEALQLTKQQQEAVAQVSWQEQYAASLLCAG
jgi:hypothetical protein